MRLAFAFLLLSPHDENEEHEGPEYAEPDDQRVAQCLCPPSDEGFIHNWQRANAHYAAYAALRQGVSLIHCMPLPIG